LRRLHLAAPHQTLILYVNAFVQNKTILVFHKFSFSPFLLFVGGGAAESPHSQGQLLLVIAAKKVFSSFIYKWKNAL
jgi:hypothetical protein